MGALRLAIVGVGNCASALVQGLSRYSADDADPIGLVRAAIGSYKISDIEVVLAFDIDQRKIGLDVAEAIFAKPNCTQVFARPNRTGVPVLMGKVLDGCAEHMHAYPEDRRFAVAAAREPGEAEVVAALRESSADVLINYLPVGSQRASAFYAECALKAGVAFVNAIPVFIASHRDWAARFRSAGVPVLGDDIKAQLGATIVHRALMDLFKRRGVALDRTYQLNTGGNTDFLNMLNRARLSDKKVSKTEAVRSAAGYALADEDIHVGPSDYVAWQNDNKICFIRMEGRGFGGVPMNLELRLSVEDSPNSAGVAIDLIRCAALARDRGLAGPIEIPSAVFCKRPPRQMNDYEAERLLAEFIGADMSAR